MNHLLKFYLKSTGNSVISRLEFKKDLFIGIFGFLIENVSYILTIFFTISSIPSFQGWSLYQMGFLYGFTLIPIGIDHLFTDELWRVAYFRVYRGDVDRYFLRPVPVLFQVIAENLQLEALGEIIVGVIMLCVCGSKSNIIWNWQLVVMVFCAAIFGAFIISGIKIFCCAPSLVFKKSGKLMQIMYNFRDYTRYPIGIYPGVIKFLLTFVFPFGLMINYPVETIFFGTYNPLIISAALIVMAIIFMAIGIIFWCICIRKYESSGS